MGKMLVDCIPDEDVEGAMEFKLEYGKLIDKYFGKAQPVCCSCGTMKNLSYAPDPFSEEINNDSTPVWECEDCRHQRAMDI